MSNEVGLSGIYHEAIDQGCSAQKHPELHVIPVCKAHFDLPAMIPQYDGNLNEGAKFFMASGIPDGSKLHDFGVTFNENLRVVLNGVYFESYAIIFPFVIIHFEIEGMERRSAGARVDLGLDFRKAKGWQGYPFPPTYCGELTVFGTHSGA